MESQLKETKLMIIQVGVIYRPDQWLDFYLLEFCIFVLMFLMSMLCREVELSNIVIVISY